MEDKTAELGRVVPHIKLSELIPHCEILYYIALREKPEVVSH